MDGFVRRTHRLLLNAAICITLLGLGSVCAAASGGATTRSGVDSRTGIDSRALRVAAVQLEIRQSDLRSVEVFRSRIESLVMRCLPFQPDLIVFPEYTSVFLALIPYYPVIRESASAEEGIERLSARDPLIAGLRDLFLLNSGLTERLMEDIFATLAGRHGVAIIPGTYFAWSGPEGGADLVNRVVVYDNNGEIVYTQDKVFLTPFEEHLLGISPGLLERAEPIVIQQKRIGITICRDTFFSQWQQVLSGVDLWIDIKANGAVFTEQERQGFRRAVPARIEEGDIPFGLTVCLTGSLLDMIWEGESSLARNDPGEEIRFVERAASASEEEILFFSIGE
jgi:predicted amidohydrolase